jgi:hypothetical protein
MNSESVGDSNALLPSPGEESRGEFEFWDLAPAIRRQKFRARSRGRASAMPHGRQSACFADSLHQWAAADRESFAMPASI